MLLSSSFLEILTLDHSIVAIAMPKFYNSRAHVSSKSTYVSLNRIHFLDIVTKKVMFD